MQTLKLGLVGVGRFGMAHARTIQYSIRGAEIQALCARTPEKVVAAAKELGVEATTTDYRKLVRDYDLDGVVICSSSASHCEHITEAVEAGIRNIFVEKPVVMSWEEVHILQSLVERNPDLFIQVGHHRRFDPSYVEAKRKLDAGLIGRPILYRNVNRDFYFDPEFLRSYSPESGGMIFDTGTHDYDMARWLLNSDGKSVYGIGGVYEYDFLEELGDIDNCCLTMEFKNGVMGDFVISRNCRYGYHVETEIYGTEGSLRVAVEPTRDRVVQFTQGGVVRDTFQDFRDFFEPCYTRELESFVENVQSGKPPVVTALDGIKSATWAFTATDAVRERKTLDLK
jgi:myo-inositol 2-dehydrogenase / D-chiro-inositol 1-dehydrogenase